MKRLGGSLHTINSYHRYMWSHLCNSYIPKDIDEMVSARYLMELKWTMDEMVHNERSS